MTLHEILNPGISREEGSFLDTFELRHGIIKRIREKKSFDVIIAGGGIHGAVFARACALNGLKTLLIERDDYASGTSSRSSKMAHGGLRYLEMFDFKQVLEGISAREDLYETGPHIVTPQPFFIPVFEGGLFFKLKLKAGLFIYDFLVKDRVRRHRWQGPADTVLSGLLPADRKLLGGFIYYDGVMNDSRLVIENIVAARQEGALCLNYARLDSLTHRNDNRVETGFRDLLSGESLQAEAGIVVNCAGPWAPMLGRITPSDLSSRVKYSKGTHLLFSKKWEGPALFLPLREKSRYYFIWPHFSGTMVGTTEKEVGDLPQDPQPSPDEIEEILSNLKRDVPGAGLDRSNLHYCFAGIRTLPVRRGGPGTSRLSRRHIWSYSAGMLSLIGGKFTTAGWTVDEGMRKLYGLSGIKGKPVSLKGRKLPGAVGTAGHVADFKRLTDEKGCPPEACEGAVRRLGARVRYIAEKDPELKVFSGVVFRGEIMLALDIEQAESLEDLFRRRLELEYMPGHGLSVLPEVISFLKQYRPLTDWDAQEREYRQRLSAIDALLRPGAMPAGIPEGKSVA